MIKVCAQLIIYGKRAQADFTGVLKEVSRAGYDGIEAGDLAAALPGDQLRNLLARTGMELGGVHIGFNALDQVDQICGYMTRVGCHHLMCSGVGDTARGRVAYEEAAQAFNKAGERCKGLGVTFCYHNHSWEFQKFDGKTGLEILFENSDPRFVAACVDTYWVKHGGQDPAAFLQKWLPRVAFLHLKDIRKDGAFAEVGQGILDWKAILAAVGRADLPWYCVEQDKTARDPEDSLRISRDFLRDSFGI